MYLHKTPSDVCTLKKKDQVLKMPQNSLLINQDIGLWGSRSITRAYLIRFVVTSLLKFTDCNCSMKSPSKAFFFCRLESLKRHLRASQLQHGTLKCWFTIFMFVFCFIFFLTVYNNFLSAPTPPPEMSYFSSLFTAAVLFTSLEPGGTSQWVNTVMSLSCGFLLM